MGSSNPRRRGSAAPTTARLELEQLHKLGQLVLQGEPAEERVLLVAALSHRPSLAPLAALLAAGLGGQVGLRLGIRFLPGQQGQQRTGDVTTREDGGTAASGSVDGTPAAGMEVRPKNSN